jgi:tripartite-type tricarboxylate transporter receptor subunit TctC
MTSGAMSVSRMGAAVLGLLVLFGTAGARADEDVAKYPTRPIQIIVPFAPGGASDLAIRLLQPGLEKALGQQLVIENKSGAAGNIGMELAAHAAPDGYTLYFGNVGTIAINPNFYPHLKVHPDRDFMPISLVSETPGIFIARPDFPAKSLKDMVAYVNAHPGKVNYAAAGISTLNTLEMEQFEHLAGLKMTQVPYKGGAGPAVVDLMGGHVDVMCVTFSSAAPHVKAGQLKGLAVTTQKRLASMPDIPTVVELGYPESVSSSWQGLFAIAGTPPAIVAKLHAAVVQSLADPKVREHMIGAGMLPNPSKSPEAFKAYIATESAKWSKVVKQIGAKVE